MAIDQKLADQEELNLLVSEFLNEKKLTFTEVAELAGTDKGTLRQALTGKRSATLYLNRLKEKRDQVPEPSAISQPVKASQNYRAYKDVVQTMDAILREQQHLRKFYEKCRATVRRFDGEIMLGYFETQGRQYVIDRALMHVQRAYIENQETQYALEQVVSYGSQLQALPSGNAPKLLPERVSLSSKITVNRNGRMVEDHRTEIPPRAQFCMLCSHRLGIGEWLQVQGDGGLMTVCPRCVDNV